MQSDASLPPALPPSPILLTSHSAHAGQQCPPHSRSQLAICQKGFLGGCQCRPYRCSNLSILSIPFRRFPQGRKSGFLLPCHPMLELLGLCPCLAAVLNRPPHLPPLLIPS